MNNQNQICQTCYQRIDASKVEPGEGYRLLTVGERRKPDDEFFVPGRGWKYMRALYVSTPLLINSAPTRRKIRVAQPHFHATDSGQRSCPVCSGEAVGGIHVVLESKSKFVKIDPGFGYRLLEIGETIRKSDEAFCEGRWKSYNDDGIVFDGVKFFFPRRRKIEAAVTPTIDPGAGFRFLEPGETISQGDEYHSFHDTWFTTSFKGRKVYAINTHLYRRKIETAVEPGEGYRLLAPNERIEVGDEVWSSFVKEWTVFFPHVAGSQLNPGLTARRKILPDPGAEYRLLTVGEVRQRGDEFFVDGVWRGPTADAGTPVWKTSWPYRRKVVPKQYRLLSVGEITESADEVWDDPSGDRPGKWKNFGCGRVVVTYSDPPVRREINSYIGGPA